MIEHVFPEGFVWGSGTSALQIEGSLRFGLVKVDSRTAERAPKASLAWYGELASTGRIDAGP